MVGKRNIRNYFNCSEIITFEVIEMKQAKVLTEKEFKKVIDMCSLYKHAERNKAILELMYFSGMRVSEISKLRVNDVLNGDGEIVDVIYLQAEQTKGNEGRRVFVGKRAKAALKRYLQSDINVIQRTFLFNTQKSKHFNTNALTQLLKRLYENAHIKGASSHSTRRTFITNLANKGVNVRVIAELASHKSIQTTQRYIDTNDTMLSNAVDLV